MGKDLDNDVLAGKVARETSLRFKERSAKVVISGIDCLTPEPLSPEELSPRLEVSTA